MTLRALAAQVLTTMAFLVAMAGSVAAQGGYEIQPGDQVRIEVLEDSSLNRDVLVLPDGSISFPLVGTIAAAGRTLDGLDAALTRAIEPNFAATPTLSVSISQLAADEDGLDEPINTYIMGEVNEPGLREVEEGTTILQLLAESGGITPFAARKRIELRRTDPDTGEVTTYLFSYDGQGRGPRIRGSTPLVAGDVVVVPSRGLFE